MNNKNKNNLDLKCFLNLHTWDYEQNNVSRDEFRICIYCNKKQIFDSDLGFFVNININYEEK